VPLWSCVASNSSRTVGEPTEAPSGVSVSSRPLLLPPSKAAAAGGGGTSVRPAASSEACWPLLLVPKANVGWAVACGALLLLARWPNATGRSHGGNKRSACNGMQPCMPRARLRHRSKQARMDTGGRGGGPRAGSVREESAAATDRQAAVMCRKQEINRTCTQSGLVGACTCLAGYRGRGGMQQAAGWVGHSKATPRGRRTWPAAATAKASDLCPATFAPPCDDDSGDTPLLSAPPSSDASSGTVGRSGRLKRGGSARISKGRAAAGAANARAAAAAAAAEEVPPVSGGGPAANPAAAAAACCCGCGCRSGGGAAAARASPPAPLLLPRGDNCCA
jgi:hypothetical protein